MHIFSNLPYNLSKSFKIHTNLNFFMLWCGEFCMDKTSDSLQWHVFYMYSMTSPWCSKIINWLEKLVFGELLGSELYCHSTKTFIQGYISTNECVTFLVLTWKYWHCNSKQHFYQVVKTEIADFESSVWCCTYIACRLIPK